MSLVDKLNSPSFGGVGDAARSGDLTINVLMRPIDGHRRGGGELVQVDLRKLLVRNACCFFAVYAEGSKAEQNRLVYGSFALI